MYFVDSSYENPLAPGKAFTLSLPVMPCRGQESEETPGLPPLVRCTLRGWAGPTGPHIHKQAQLEDPHAGLLL